MYESYITADREKRPEHQIILCGYTAHMQLIIYPVKQGICTDALIRCFPRAFRDHLIAMPVCACIITARPQAGKACQQNDDQ